MPTRTDSIQALTGFPPLVRNVPPNYPTRPMPDKISLLWKYNKKELYHKFSPYTYGDNIFGIFPNKQPFIYRYPDEVGNSQFDKLPTAVKTLAASGNITQGTMDDVVRVGKYSYSPLGLLYNVKQFGLQRLNSFDETRLYNPLSPILATIAGMTFGIGERPVRHIEGSVLFGLLNSITSTVGINFQNGFQTPASTVGDGALSPANVGQGKGLLRGSDAQKAIGTLQSKWQVSSGGAPVGLAGFTSMLKNTAQALFGNAPKSDGTYRADEMTYVLMVNSKDKFKTYSIFGSEFPVSQSWVAITHEYENSVGKDASQMLTLFDNYTSQYTKVESKFNEPTLTPTQQLAAQLKKTLTSLNNAGTYEVSTNTYSKLVASGDVQSVSYDNLFKNIVPNQQKSERGVGNDYHNSRFSGPRPIDKTFGSRNLKMATSFTSDGINQLGVLDGSRKIESVPALSKAYPGWTEYKPYEDDLIAFFFYDVVNSKYIPFRATVKGLSEGNTAFWDELRFIGRADQLYSYNGFSRTLGFTFNIVIGSVTELLPTWQKVNYIMSAVKPSNYTIGDNQSGVFSRFIVPPMFMITIGDLYKFQPMVITSINLNVPDDAAWETLNENNSSEWSYLTNIIKAPTIGKNYAQLPREVEIAVTCNLLEKERAVVGGSHFGHSPRKDNWETRNGNGRFVAGGKDYLPSITSFHSSSTVFNPPNSVPEHFDSEAGLVAQ